jgi:hypothetical protein
MRTEFWWETCKKMTTGKTKKAVVRCSEAVQGRGQQRIFMLVVLIIWVLW